MTRQEFIEDVGSFRELVEFCRVNRIDICDDVIDSASLNDYISHMIPGFNSWMAIQEYLSRIPIGCEYYRIDGYGRPEEVESMFECYKSDVLQAMDIAQQWAEGDQKEDEEEDREIEDNKFLIAMEG